MYGYVAGLPAFLAYFGTGIVLLFAFATIYSLVTPQKEITLMRSGNCAAATAYLGALLGFSFPLGAVRPMLTSLHWMQVWL